VKGRFVDNRLVENRFVKGRLVEDCPLTCSGFLFNSRD
jgi:hypothetical protein